MINYDIFKIVVILLRVGSDVNAKEKSGITPLHTGTFNFIFYLFLNIYSKFESLY